MATNTIVLPAPVIALVQAAFQDAPSELTPTEGGFSNLTCGATIGGVRCIIKAATLPVKRADVRHEAAVLQMLDRHHVANPRLLALCEDAAWTVAVTEARPGWNGLRVLQETPEELPRVYRALGRALACLHQTVVTRFRGDSLALRVAHARENLSHIESPQLRVALEQSLSHAVWRADHACLLHGDLGLHNTLWDNHDVTLVDWEWASFGTPHFDLAWLGWTLRWRGLERLWPAFYESYQAHGGTTTLPSAQVVQTLELGQIAMILARVAALPTATAEWQRRAAWTLDKPAAAF